MILLIFFAGKSTAKPSEELGVFYEQSPEKLKPSIPVENDDTSTVATGNNDSSESGENTDHETSLEKTTSGTITSPLMTENTSMPTLDDCYPQTRQPSLEANSHTNRASQDAHTNTNLPALSHSNLSSPEAHPHTNIPSPEAHSHNDLPSPEEHLHSNLPSPEAHPHGNLPSLESHLHTNQASLETHPDTNPLSSSSSPVEAPRTPPDFIERPHKLSMINERYSNLLNDIRPVSVSSDEGDLPIRKPYRSELVHQYIYNHT